MKPRDLWMAKPPRQSLRGAIASHFVMFDTLSRANQADIFDLKYYPLP
jgi:hypothetical protein